MVMRKGLPAKLAATDADDTRYLFSGLVVCNADGTPRGGVLSPVGVNLVTATATMNVSVARFQGAAVRDAGVVLLANDGPANVLLDAAPAANSRKDVIWAKQNDASSTVTVPDANNLPVLGVSKGTAGPGDPAKPSIPAGALELATVQIPSTATATNSSGVVITQSAPFTAAAGGVVQFRTEPAMMAWVTAPDGQRARVLAAGAEYVSDGAGGWTQGGTNHIQLDTTNSIVAGLVTQYGIGFVKGTATTDISKAVVFPRPFASVPFFRADYIGGRLSGPFNPLGLLPATQSTIGNGVSPSLTGSNVIMHRTDGAVLTATWDYYYVWSATGVLA